MAPIMAHAQEATELEEIVVTGIRASFSSAMDVKRQSFGVVDGIVAEDIGKFPDTNLAESLQRISGVSIDRSLGEGSKITVRGVGPDFNLVLLNGRQMPASSIADTMPPVRARSTSPTWRPSRSARSRSSRPVAPACPRAVLAPPSTSRRRVRSTARVK